MDANNQLAKAIIEISHQAGEAILEVYEQDFEVNTKSDDSPVTKADLAANQVIIDELEALTPDIPVISEELPAAATTKRNEWPRYWLIDPLDGTKHFVRKDGQFTVNIALMQNHKPVLGVVYAPCASSTYWAIKNDGAFKLNEQGHDQRIYSTSPHTDERLVLHVGRFSQNPKTEQFVQRLNSYFGEIDIQPMGSSLKMCLIAEGKADIYPRFGKTSEWDTAAAHVILQEAGGDIMSVGTGFNTLRYNLRDDLINPEFIAAGKRFSPELLKELLYIWP